MSYKEYKVSVYDGNIRWYNQKGQYHREDGPAIEYAGDKHWFKNDQYHREDGPAIEYANGIKSWYLEGKQLTEEDWKAKMNPMNPAKEMTVQEISDMLGFEVKVVKD